MDIIERLTYASWIFRVVVMVVGLVVIVVGLYLFRQPAQRGSAGTLNAEYSGGKISLRGAAGTFFLVLGTIIVLVGLLRSTVFDWSRITRAPRGGETFEDFHGAPATADPESVKAWIKSGRLDSIVVVGDPYSDSAFRVPRDSAAHP
jgi:hypothetical protein